MAAGNVQKMAADAVRRAGGTTQEQVAAAQQKKEQQAEQRRMMLASICTQDARERISRLRLVKPEKADMVEVHLMKQARSGALVGKVTDDQVKRILEEIESRAQAKKVRVVRRNVLDEEDDLDLDDF